MTDVAPTLVVRNTFLDFQEDEVVPPDSSRRSCSAPCSWKPLTARSTASAAGSTACPSVISDIDPEGTPRSGDAPGSPSPSWADIDPNSDDDFFDMIDRHRANSWGMQQQYCSPASSPSSSYLGNTLTKLLPPPTSAAPSQQADAATTPGGYLGNTLSKVSSNTWEPPRQRLSSMATSFAPSVVEAGTRTRQLPARQTPPVPTAVSDDLESWLQAVSSKKPAGRRSGGATGSRRGGRTQMCSLNSLLCKGRKQGCSVCSAVEAALANTTGVAAVNVSKDGNRTTFAVDVSSRSDVIVDAAVKAAKAAMLNASALSMGSYVIGYLKTPFEEFPGGFRAVLGVVQRIEEATACWKFYECGECDDASCARQHPEDADLTHITVVFN